MDSKPKVGVLIQECINHLIWSSRPKKDKAYRIWKELKSLDYKVPDYQSFEQRLERYYNHRTHQNQAKLIKEMLNLPPNSEVGRILAIDFRTGEVDAKKLHDASKYIYHQLRSTYDLKTSGVDEFTVYNALKKTTNPSHMDKSHSLDFSDYWGHLENIVWREYGSDRLETVKALGQIIDPKAKVEETAGQVQGDGDGSKEKPKSGEEESVAGETPTTGFTQDVKGDHYTGTSSHLTKSITQTEYEWLRQLHEDGGEKIKPFTKWPLTKRSENTHIQKIEDLSREFNLYFKNEYKFNDEGNALAKEKRQPTLEAVGEILKVFDKEPEQEVKFIREGTDEKTLRAMYLKPEDIDRSELRVLIGMLRAIKDYRWRGQVKWHRGGKTLYVFKAKELFSHR